MDIHDDHKAYIIHNVSSKNRNDCVTVSIDLVKV